MVQNSNRKHFLYWSGTKSDFNNAKINTVLKFDVFLKEKFFLDDLSIKFCIH